MNGKKDEQGEERMRELQRDQEEWESKNGRGREGERMNEGEKGEENKQKRDYRSETVTNSRSESSQELHKNH